MDLNAAVLAYDNSGGIIDSVNFDRSTALEGLIEQVGDKDEFPEEAAGFDELVEIDMDNIPLEIRILAVVVSAYDAGHFGLVGQMSCIFQSVAEGAEPINNVSVTRSFTETDDMMTAGLCWLHRDPADIYNWKIGRLDEISSAQRTFVSVLPKLSERIEGCDGIDKAAFLKREALEKARREAEEAYAAAQRAYELTLEEQRRAAAELEASQRDASAAREEASSSARLQDHSASAADKAKSDYEEAQKKLKESEFKELVLSSATVPIPDRAYYARRALRHRGFAG